MSVEKEDWERKRALHEGDDELVVRVGGICEEGQACPEAAVINAFSATLRR